MAEKREKRRNCADRIRGEALMRKIHRRKRFDPAMSFFIQMLGLTSFVINLFPPFPVFARAAAEPLPNPPRSIPVQASSPEPRTYKRAPSWPRLMKDLARPVAYEQARMEVYARLPIECRPWLDVIFRESDWSAIRPYVRSGVSDDEVSAGVLGAFRTWMAQQEQRAREAKKEAAGGRAGTASKPGASGDDPEDDAPGM